MVRLVAPWLWNLRVCGSSLGSESCKISSIFELRSLKFTWTLRLNLLSLCRRFQEARVMVQISSNNIPTLKTFISAIKTFIYVTMYGNKVHRPAFEKIWIQTHTKVSPNSNLAANIEIKVGFVILFYLGLIFSQGPNSPQARNFLKPN
jgi:hypothetical protein